MAQPRHQGGCGPRRVAAAAAALLLYQRLGGARRSGGAAPAQPAWAAAAGGSLLATAQGCRPRPGGDGRPPVPTALHAAANAPPIVEMELAFDPKSPVDMAEKKLIGTTLCLTSSVFGFPDFKSLVDLRRDGSVYFYGGMISKEPGRWSVIEGDPTDGESPDDLYLELVQPLTERYINIFTVPGGTCFWRAKLNFQVKGQGKVPLAVLLEGGLVVSEREEGKKLVREGIFTAVAVDEEAATEVQRKNAEAFERALTTPKVESTGFKTPARIAGINTRRPQRQLGAGKQDEVDLEDDD